jgi:hypothetical protein
MKPFAFLTLALLVGCSASTPTPPTAADSDARRATASRASLELPPGHMDVTWTPTEPDPPKELRPSRVRDPLFASKQSRTRLFALPSKRAK